MPVYLFLQEYDMARRQRREHKGGKRDNNGDKEGKGEGKGGKMDGDGDVEGKGDGSKRDGDGNYGGGR
jgi:hypothetical protein